MASTSKSYIVSAACPMPVTPDELSRLALAVPALRFIGTIPEGFAFGQLPGYSAIAIGSVAWRITMASDIYFERLALSGRSAVFGGLVMTGIIFQLLDRAAFQRLNRRF